MSSELKKIEKHRLNIRKKRQSDDILQIAVVGYTNAGKSSLINLLTGENDAYVENKLFATLDPIIRKITLSDRTEVLISDTVGFIRKLPHHLIDAFKSTLEEVKYADIILHLIDSSANDSEKCTEVVENVLKELGADNKPTIKVFNKCDIVLPKREVQDNESITVSVKEKINIDKLLYKINEIIEGLRKKITVKIPFSEGRIKGYIYKNASVINENICEDGYIIEAVADEECYNKIKQWEITFSD